MKRIAQRSSFIISLIMAKFMRRNVPLFVFFTITNKCNASCNYCFGKYYERYNFERNKELSTDQVFIVIDELAKMGTKRISLSGGEPLLREDIGDIISRIKEKGMECGLNSNGFLAPEKINEIIKLDSITISLDGDKDAHEANRGKGTFEKVMGAIKAVKTSKIPLHVSTVITKNNMNSIDYIMELAKKIGFLVQFSPMYDRFWGDEDDNFPDRLNAKEYNEVINRFLFYKKKGYPVFYSYKTYRNILSWPDFKINRFIDEEPKFSYTKCYMGKYLCTIDANGDVYPCAQLDGFKVKNCLEVGFKEAFENISSHNCKACMWACYNEYNLLFSLHPGTVIDTIKNSLFHYYRFLL